MLRKFQRNAVRELRCGQTTLSCRAGTVRISNPAVFARSAEAWQKFAVRILRLPDVESIDLDLNRGTAIIAYSEKELALEQFLEAMSIALQQPNDHPIDDQTSALLSALAERLRFRLVRRGAGLSPWEILHELPDRLRVRDASLCGRPEAAGRLATSLRLLDGVKTASTSSLTGSVVIHYDPSTIDRARLLTHFDRWVWGGPISPPALQNSRPQWIYAHATLGLALAGAFVYPPLLPVSAVLLVASNIPTFRQAWTQVRQGRIGLPVLHTAIVGATLASGGFVAASLMNWLLLYWKGRQARLAASGEQMLVNLVHPQPAVVWVVRDGVELETPVANLETGAVVRIRSGETVPIDGRIVSGNAALIEAPVSGGGELIHRRLGDEVLAGSHIVEGELLVRVVRTGHDTLAGRVRRALSATASTRAGDRRTAAAPRLAERAVSPTLLTAGVGLLVGDAASAAAILRPDYATGEGLGDSAALLDRLEACLTAGIVVRRTDAFRQIADANLVLIDDDRHLDGLDGGEAERSLAEVIRDLRCLCGMEIEIFSERTAGEADRLADRLGLDGVRCCPSDAAKAELLTKLRAAGRRIVYVGNARQNPQTAAAANVAIFPDPFRVRDASAQFCSTDADDASGVWLLQPSLGKLVRLHELARSLDRHTQINGRFILVPNLACIAGAFLLGFSSLAVVVVSNLGILTVYSRSRQGLMRTERRLRSRRQEVIRRCAEQAMNMSPIVSDDHDVPPADCCQDESEETHETASRPLAEVT